MTSTLYTTAAAVAAEALRYWKGRPQLAPISSPQKLRDLYNESGGYYFNPDTLRCFGSRNFHMAAPGVSVETQLKAPEGVGRYCVTAWVFDCSNAGRLQPINLAMAWTLAEARKLAVEVAELWGRPDFEILCTLVADGWNFGAAVAAAEALEAVPA